MTESFDLARLERLLEEAASRPWEGPGVLRGVTPEIACIASPTTIVCHLTQGSEPDGALIVAAVNALPSLVRAVKAARLSAAAFDAYHDAIDRTSGAPDWKRLCASEADLRVALEPFKTEGEG